ncbi:MAG: 30S ribosomal protein S7 [Chloroflexota bacterium]|nr:30S ribosomal protein S7 [Chloroflexota bacterium]
MPRKAKKSVKRVVSPEAKYGSVTVAKFINKIMLRGQKATAERIVYNALQIASGQLEKEPMDVLEQAIRNATPLLMVRSRRVGGATYQVPLEVEAERGQKLAMRWIISSVRGRSGKSMAEKLADELIDAFQGRGVTIKKREDVHKMAQANKAFAHFRW